MSLSRVLAILATSLLSTSSFAAGSCDSLDACLVRMQALAKSAESNDHSLCEEEVEVTERVVQFQGAVPRLVPLLASPNKQLAKLASTSLANASYIDAKYYPQIIAGLDRGLGWLPGALCSMPGEAPAREAVARFLVSREAPQNQEAFAVVRCKQRALPFIVQAARCTPRCPPDTHSNLAYVLEEMEPEVSSAIAQPLMEIARDPRSTEDTARGAVDMIRALGKSAASLQKQLLELRSKRPNLAGTIDAALIGLHAPTAAAILAERLKDADSEFGVTLTLRDIAELGVDGRDAGEAVVAVLRGDNMNSRVPAARALGFIDYQPAVPLLIQAINDPADMRLNWVAVQSLGRLRNRTAVAALQAAAKQHWYTPVRRAATAALARIHDGTTHEPQFHVDNFPFEFFAYEIIGEPGDSCPSIAIPPLPDAEARKLRANSDSVSTLKYKREAGPPEQGRKPRMLTRTPDISLRVANGWLTGADHGEWGGELMFIGDDRSQRVLAEQNVHDIFVLGKRIVALTGLAHLSLNRGMIFELRQERAGAWSAVPWRALPGAPSHSYLVNTGELAIDAYGGGSILVAPDGSMRMACSAIKQ